MIYLILQFIQTALSSAFLMVYSAGMTSLSLQGKNVSTAQEGKETWMH